MIPDITIEQIRAAAKILDEQAIPLVNRTVIYGDDGGNIIEAKIDKNGDVTQRILNALPPE